MKVWEFIGLLIHGVRDTEARIRERKFRMLYNEADYKDGLADNYDEAGLHRRAGELRQEASELRLEAEYDVITSDAQVSEASEASEADDD